MDAQSTLARNMPSQTAFLGYPYLPTLSIKNAFYRKFTQCHDRFIILEVFCVFEYIFYK